MKTSSKRQLEDWELAECASLKAAINAFNQDKDKNGRITQEAAGEALGITQGAFSNYLNGRLALNLEIAIGVSKLFGIPISAFSSRLAKEIASASGRQAQLVEPSVELIGTMAAWDSSTPLYDDEVALPFYKEVQIAAGSRCGSTEVIEVPGRLLRFARSTLRDAGVQPEHAVCASIKGRSMERLILDGATIGIDTSDKAIVDGEIYAFDQDGMLRVKYLYRLPGGGVRIRSENAEEFPDEFLTAEEFAQIRMLGWVFWWSTVRKKRGLSTV